LLLRGSPRAFLSDVIVRVGNDNRLVDAAHLTPYNVKGFGSAKGSNPHSACRGACREVIVGPGR
jgi:hypothetical protein